MAKFNISGVEGLQYFLDRVASKVTESLHSVGLEGNMIFSGPDSRGNLDLNIIIEASPMECLHGKLNPDKIAKLLTLRAKSLSLYNYWQGEVWGSTPMKNSEVAKESLAVLKAFSNNIITVHCPKPIGPTQMRVE